MHIKMFYYNFSLFLKCMEKSSRVLMINPNPYNTNHMVNSLALWL